MTIVALGDSITAGTPAFLSPVESPPNGFGNEKSQYGYWVMQQHPQWTLLNRGVGGERSDEILKRFDRDVLQVKPKVVIVLAGVNDLYQGYEPEWVIKNLEKIYAKAEAEQIKVLACTILPYNGSSLEVQEGMNQINQWIQSYAEETGFGFCDTHTLMAHPNNPNDLVSEVDGIHPDVEGHKRLGLGIAQALEKLIQ